MTKYERDSKMSKVVGLHDDLDSWTKHVGKSDLVIEAVFEDLGLKHKIISQYEDIIPATHTAHIPVVTRKDYDLIDISDDGFLTLMDDEGEMKEDLKLPEVPESYSRDLKIAFEKAQEASTGISVSVLTAMGHEQVMSHKELTEGK